MDLKANAAGWSRRLAQWAGALGVVALLRLRRQLALLASVLAALLVLGLWPAWSEYRQAHLGGGYLLVAAELRMHAAPGEERAAQPARRPRVVSASAGEPRRLRRGARAATRMGRPRS